ncbi:MAG: hypothetical protein H7336_10475 [Bacteriovorax sp.]|nr:hypothetical protein [Bacteriovorax sp.]
MKKLAFLFSLLFIGPVWAMALEEVTLQELSSSGRSLVIDRGTLEQFKEGIFAKFYVQNGPKEFPKIFLVGEGELVKSFPKKSYWLLKQVYIPDAMKSNSKLLIMTSTDITAGRPLKLTNRHIVMPSSEYSDVDDYLDKNQGNVPAKFVKEGGAYETSPDIFEEDEMKHPTPGSDVTVSTYEKYKKKSGNYYSEQYGDITAENYFIGNKQVELGDIRKSEDKKLFDSVSDGAIAKTNNMKYGVKNFYREQEREKNLPELAKNGTQASTFEEMKYEKKQKDIVSPKAVAKLRRDGDQWSSDMDDASLRKYFISTGIEKESRRRELALNELEGHEIMLHFSNALNSHGNATDPNYNGRGYNLGIAYDLHLARTSDNLKNWSLQFMLEKGVTEYDTGVFNARSEETSYGAYVNYYFVNNPLTLNSFIWLAGVGLKNGSASVFSPDLSKEYSYQVFTLPALQVMTKYRFRSGDLTEDNVNIGASLNFGLNIDMKKLSVIDRLDDNINSNISVTDLKYTVGMSVYF